MLVYVTKMVEDNIGNLSNGTKMLRRNNVIL